MKKLIMCIGLIFTLCFCFELTSNATSNGISTEYGDIVIKDIYIDKASEKLIISTEANVYKNEECYVEVLFYKYDNNDLELEYGTGYSEDIQFGKGRNQEVNVNDYIDNLRWSLQSGTYAIEAVLHDYKGYEDNDYDENTACFAVSPKIFKNIEISDSEIKFNDYQCKDNKHLYSQFETTKKATVSKEGEKKSTCFYCGNYKTSKIGTIKPTIKLSSTSKTIREKHSFKLKVSNLAYGDSISSVKVSSKKIATIKRKGNTITITGKKTGKTNITIKLKSGKKATCKIKVTKDKFTYTISKLSYSTRNNTYSIKLKNTAKHKVTIYATGAKCMDWDYKRFDRKVKSINGKKKIDIKPGKTITLKFKLSSKATWPGYERKTIKFKTKFNGEYKWIKISEKNW